MEPQDFAEFTKLLSTYLELKYISDICYRNFSDRLCGPYREAITQHWLEHAEDERKMAYDITMKSVSMGIDPVLISIRIPPTEPDVNSLISTLKSVEKVSVTIARMLMDCCEKSGDVAFRILLENHVVLDTHHFDDLVRMSTQNG